MLVRNRTRGTILARTVLTLSSRFQKTLTAINRRGVPAGFAIWIAPCNGIYTVGMGEPVDIAFLDREGRIVKMLRNFPPDCFTDSAPNAVSAIKLPSNMLKISDSRAGDIIEIDPD